MTRNDEGMMPTSLVRVELGARTYDIRVGDGLLAWAGDLMRAVMSQPRCVIVTDDNVAPLHLAAIEASLSAAGIEHTAIVLPAGEQTKDFEPLRSLVDRLLEARVERVTSVVALGGGVIGDLAGFAAAITLRGIDVIQVPTTLLAQVDSSVGGKTGINARQGKNLIGAFHQPILVLADIDTLDTLPRRELLAGYAETVKYGLIEDAGFFEWMERNGAAFCSGDHAVRAQAVVRACKAKAEVVAEDEHESGRRALLNFGHTFGHALEAETGYGERLLHGEAVAIGMTLATDLSVRLGLCPPNDAERSRRHMAETGLPVDMHGIKGADWSAESLMAHMMSDKKVRGKRPTFVLTRGIGRAFTTQDVDTEILHDFLDKALNA